MVGVQVALYPVRQAGRGKKSARRLPGRNVETNIVAKRCSEHLESSPHGRCSSVRNADKACCWSKTGHVVWINDAAYNVSCRPVLPEKAEHRTFGKANGAKW